MFAEKNENVELSENVESLTAININETRFSGSVGKILQSDLSGSVVDRKIHRLNSHLHDDEDDHHSNDGLSENEDFESNQPWTEVRRASGNRQTQKKKLKAIQNGNSASIGGAAELPRFTNANHYRDNHNQRVIIPNGGDINHSRDLHDNNNNMSTQRLRMEKSWSIHGVKNMSSSVVGVSEPLNKSEASNTSSPVPSISPDLSSGHELGVNLTNSNYHQHHATHRYQNNNNNNRTFPRHSHKPSRSFRMASNPDVDDSVHSHHSASSISNPGINNNHNGNNNNSNNNSNNGGNYFNRPNNNGNGNTVRTPINRSSTMNGPNCNHTNGPIQQSNQHWRRPSNGSNWRRQPYNGPRNTNNIGSNNNLNGGVSVPNPINTTATTNSNSSQFNRHHFPATNSHVSNNRSFTNNFNRHRNALLSHMSSPSPPPSTQRSITESQPGNTVEKVFTIDISNNNTYVAPISSLSSTATINFTKSDQVPNDNPSMSVQEQPQSRQSSQPSHRTSWAATVAACSKPMNKPTLKVSSNLSNSHLVMAAATTTTVTNHAQLVNFLLDQWRCFDCQCS